jgi:hypothetical protein
MTLGFMIIVVTFFFPAVAAELALILEIGSYQWRLLPPVRKKKKDIFFLSNLNLIIPLSFANLLQFSNHLTDLVYLG